ncbi:MAG TPA: hypothetical protein VNJ71_01615 [Gemmatimonadales bacterium]|nr:hypothetical protein [Gemmatimonadales bacterium]
MLRLVARSHLAALVWNETDLLRARIGLLEWQFPGGVLRERAGSRDWTVTASFCRGIHQLVAAQGGRTIFLLLPERLQLDPPLLSRYASALGVDTADVDPEQPNRLLGRELAREGLVVLDALPVLRQAYAAGQEVYGNVDLHLGRAGHAIVAELLEPAVQEALTSAK